VNQQCILTQETSQFPTEQRALCEKACIDDKNWFVCDTVPNKPVRNGKCKPAKATDPKAFYCLNGDCNNCATSNCSSVQYWKCTGAVGNCEEVLTSSESDVSTNPLDPATWSRYDDCVNTTCIQRIKCPEEKDKSGICTTYVANSGTALPAGITPAEWCRTNCVNVGIHKWWWDPNNKVCAVPPPDVPKDATIYDTKAECLKAECEKNQQFYCDGASECGEFGSICCGSSYCNPITKCEMCVNGQCLDKCKFDKNGKKLDSPCGTCNDKTGTCVLGCGSESGGGHCLCDKGFNFQDNPERCHCESTQLCAAKNLVWNNGIETSKYYCPTGGWCMNKNQTKTVTYAPDDKTDPDPKTTTCFDGSPCFLVSGPSYPDQNPAGSAGCWPPSTELTCTKTSDSPIPVCK
jgi:hypothetical protein